MPKLCEPCPICEKPMITVEARINGDITKPRNRWSRKKVGSMCLEPGCKHIKREYFVSFPSL